MSMVMLLSYPVVGEIAARFVAILVISDHITRLLRWLWHGCQYGSIYQYVVIISHTPAKHCIQQHGNQRGQLKGQCGTVWLIICSTLRQTSIFRPKIHFRDQKVLFCHSVQLVDNPLKMDKREMCDIKRVVYESSILVASTITTTGFSFFFLLRF